MKKLITAVSVYLALMLPAYADIYINVVAVNGASTPKTSTIHFDLPGELTSEDIVDTNGLQLDYSVDDANYFVYGDVTLKPKESKTFRIQVRDKWMVSTDDATSIKSQIDKGFESLGKPYNQPNADILKSRLESKIDYILNLQTNSADSIEKRMADYRVYEKELKRVQDDALDVSYWRSDPNNQDQPKIVHLNIEVTNPTDKPKDYKHKDYLPAETKIEDVVEAEDFEVRFDPVKSLAFLFKEEELKAHETKKYSIGIVDIWNIPQKNIDYLRARTKYAYDVLKDTKYAETAQIFSDRINANLKAIEDSQTMQREILDHISAYRANMKVYGSTEQDVLDLEKLLAAFREDLEKSKVENILQKIQTLKGVSDVSKVMFNKKFESSTAWSFIGWILLFVGLLTLISFVVSLMRSKEKKIEDATSPKKPEQP